jgi:4-amino-4-deoxy-L-arabinose transferase-like glycosyltransferase
MSPVGDHRTGAPSLGSARDMLVEFAHCRIAAEHTTGMRRLFKSDTAQLFWVLVVLGFGLRMGYGIARYRASLAHLSGPAFINRWDHDALAHVLIAKAVLSGEGYIVDDFPVPPQKHLRYAGQEALFKAPFYEFFLAGVFAVSGFSFKLFFPLQALFGGLISGFVGLIAWETFRRLATAWLAGLAAAAHPILVNSASEPYNENLFFFLFIAAIWLFLVWFRNRDIKWAILCGVTVGLCMLTRESGLVLLVAMCAVGILSSPRDWGAFVAQGIIVVAALAMVAPWTIRNYVRFHAFIPVAAITGEDLSEGNNECVGGESFFASYWAEGPCLPLNRRVAELRAATSFPNLPECVRSDRLSRLAAVDYIRQHPLVYVELAIRRLWTSLLPYVPRGNQRWHERIVLTLYWLAIFPAGAIGLVLSLRRIRPRTALLGLLIALNFASIMAVLYWSDLRFRVGIDLLLGCFAAWSYTQLRQRTTGPANGS